MKLLKQDKVITLVIIFEFLSFLFLYATWIISTEGDFLYLNNLKGFLSHYYIFWVYLLITALFAFKLSFWTKPLLYIQSYLCLVILSWWGVILSEKFLLVIAIIYFVLSIVISNSYAHVIDKACLRFFNSVNTIDQRPLIELNVGFYNESGDLLGNGKLLNWDIESCSVLYLNLDPKSLSQITRLNLHVFNKVLSFKTVPVMHHQNKKVLGLEFINGSGQEVEWSFCYQSLMDRGYLPEYITQ